MEKLVQYRFNPNQLDNVAFIFDRNGGYFNQQINLDELKPLNYRQIHTSVNSIDFSIKMRQFLFSKFQTNLRQNRHFKRRHQEYLERIHDANLEFYENWLLEGVI